MNKRNLMIALGALLVVLAAGFGLSLTQKKDPPGAETKAEVAEAKEDAFKDACASAATYDRLKQVVFEEAVRVRNADPTNLDTLATHSVVRMEQPVVKSRDDELNVTVCTGRFVLELPPGAERGFAGERRLMANVEYAAQAAADGSGLVYQMSGAEPIIYRLASFDLQGQRYQPPGAPPQGQFAEATSPLAAPGQAPVQTQPAPAVPPRAEPAPSPAPIARAEPAPRPAPVPREAPVTRPAPTATASARPSFNCASARTRSERMVCSNGGLASRDRAMSSQYYSALAGADSDQRRALRKTRDRFLAYRERCGSEACVAEAYEGRMMEIRDIMAR